jgi:ATP-dependent DNA helicase RecG
MLGKGEEPAVLLLTATPIPRTLALALYGDMEVSEIRSLPPGRRSVITHLARRGNERKVYEAVRRELAAGGQAYFVYPLIESSEEMFGRLSHEIYPEYRCTLIHSRLEESEKELRMHAFSAGEAQVLVATSVVEVGVDVPGAVCMVVEHAERFGLDPLERGRHRPRIGHFLFHH